MGRPRKNVEVQVSFKALISPKQYFCFGEDGENFRAINGVFTTQDADVIEFLSKNPSCWERLGVQEAQQAPPIITPI